MDKKPSLFNLITSIVSHSKDYVLAKIVDDVIFPWYEAKTGKHNSSKLMRRQVAEKVEQSLSATLWITKGSALDLGEDGLDEEMSTPPRFIVGNVFPQSRTNGQYDLMVNLHQKGIPSNSHIMTLETFMRDFVPYDEVGFTDFDS